VQNHIATGGYDRAVNLWDVRTGQLMKKFSGHSASVSHVIFNPYGNLIISGSKDNTVKFWDITSGLCIKTYSTYLGSASLPASSVALRLVSVVCLRSRTHQQMLGLASEVTSVAMSQNGSLLLTSSKDNSNRLWDVRTVQHLPLLPFRRATC
jgi:WD40 repeat protein